MPTYEYKCLICDKKYEYFHKMTEDPVYKCPDCGMEMKRMIGSGAGPIFKGTGFYQTDYKNKGTQKTAQKNSSGSAKKE